MDEASKPEELATREREDRADLKKLIDAIPAPCADEPTVAVSALETSREAVVLAMTRRQQVSPQALELFSESAYRHGDDRVPGSRRSFEATRDEE